MYKFLNGNCADLDQEEKSVIYSFLTDLHKLPLLFFFSTAKLNNWIVLAFIITTIVDVIRNEMCSRKNMFLKINNIQEKRHEEVSVVNIIQLY